MNKFSYTNTDSDPGSITIYKENEPRYKFM